VPRNNNLNLRYRPLRFEPLSHVNVAPAMSPDTPEDRVLHVVRVVVPTEDGRYVMVKRLPDAGNNPGKWEFPGGKVDPGATKSETGLDELRQEIGLTDVSTDTDLRPVYCYQMTDDPRKRIYQGWHTTALNPLDSIRDLTPQATEIAEIRALSLREIAQIPMALITNMALRQTALLT
jgi:8-oxo-dGTP pyrophosphatase MutT (NUDIX family)